MRTSKSDLAQVIRLVESNDRAAEDQFGGGLKTLFGVPLLPMLYDLRDSLTMEKLHVNPTLHNVVNNLVDERSRQDEKWGGAGHDDQHTVAEFVQWIEDYAGWARMMDSMNSPEKARRRLVQVAALAVAAVEKIDRDKARREWEPVLAGDSEELGQFGHHADSAIDFCHEVECLQGMVTDARLGLVDWSSLNPRLVRALAFRVGGDEGAMKAKEELRSLAETVHWECMSLADRCKHNLQRDTVTAPDLRRVEEVAIIEMPDPEDERPGLWLSTKSRRTLERLPPGTKLYVEVGE